MIDKSGGVEPRVVILQTSRDETRARSSSTATLTNNNNKQTNERTNERTARITLLKRMNNMMSAILVRPAINATNAIPSFMYNRYLMTG